MHHIELADIKLYPGSHASAPADTNGQACVMEWVSVFAGVDFGDHPVCTSNVLANFGIALNDGLPDEARQRLVPFIPRLVGTAGDPAADQVRAWMATDWLVRVHAVTWLRKAGLTARADELAALPELSSKELAAAAQAIIEAAKAEAYAARAAARATAGAAAWAAAGAAVWTAAWDAAGDAVWTAAWDAAGDAARTTAGAAVWAAVWAAAWDAAGDAARTAAWDAAGDAAWAAASKKKGYSAQYDAAYKAAKPILDQALAETNAELLDSALDLFGKMADYRTAVPA